MAIRNQTKVLTAIVGSYPKPRYVYRQNGRSLLDSFGFSFERRQKELGTAEFARLLDKAAVSAIEDQDRAGIDIVTDGEERRGHYVLHIVNKLAGIDACNRKRISMRGGTTQPITDGVGDRSLPIVQKLPHRKQAIHRPAEEFMSIDGD